MDAVYGLSPIDNGGIPIRSDDTHRSHTDASFPNDPRFKHQWHLQQVNVQGAWKTARGKDIVVAVIDTGVAYSSGGGIQGVPDLKETRIVAGYDFVNDDRAGLDDHGHGTHVAGTIAQSTHNGIGVAGIAFEASIMPIKVLSARGFGTVGDIAEAVRFAANHGAHIINMSLGGSRRSAILANAIAYAKKKGVLVVCAAGNNGRDRVSFPAAYPGAIAVAATQFDRSTAFYSNWGSQIALAAPGGNTRVDQNGDGLPDGILQNTIIPGKPAENDYLFFMGTSMACPHVAAIAALIASKGVTDPKTIRDVLERTAVHPHGLDRDAHYGAGIVDAAAALDYVEHHPNLATSLNNADHTRKTGAAPHEQVSLPNSRRSERTRIGVTAKPDAQQPRSGNVRMHVIVLSWFSLALLLGAGLLGYLKHRRVNTIPICWSMPLGALAGGTILLIPYLWHLSWVYFGKEIVALEPLRVVTQQSGVRGIELSPLLTCAFVPFACIASVYHWTRLRPALFAFCIGFSSALGLAALARIDVSWVPFDEVWLVGNGLASFGLAALVARR